jgi:hypothetical protein
MLWVPSPCVSPFSQRERAGVRELERHQHVPLTRPLSQREGELTALGRQAWPLLPMACRLLEGMG